VGFGAIEKAATESSCGSNGIGFSCFALPTAPRFTTHPYNDIQKH